MMSVELIDTEKTAEILGVSKASIRNWIKHGYLKPADSSGRYFELAQILQLQEEIAEGKVDRLRKRANKARAEKNFAPSEYINKGEAQRRIFSLVKYLIDHKIDIKLALLVLALNLFRTKGELKSAELQKIMSFPSDLFNRQHVRLELKEFYLDSRIDDSVIKKRIESLEFIFEYPLPEVSDFLGTVYQCLVNEGNKSRLGSYYTPIDIVDRMVKENLKSGETILDPCCGTGQFLISAAGILEEPNNIWGLDVDLTAVRIARLNLLLKYSKDFHPNIYCRDTLNTTEIIDTVSTLAGHFDLVATNPPWGAEISKHTLKKLAADFPEITSGESFSYFLRTSLDLLQNGGMGSFVLPEAILNIRIHSEIRKYILENCQIRRIEFLGKKFKNVFSSVIVMDLTKTKPEGTEEILVKFPEKEYYVPQKRFQQNKWKVFDVCLSVEEEKIIQKVFQTKHRTLIDKADWALGIVTGDNKKFIKNTSEEDVEPVYKGSDIQRFFLREACCYIKFIPEQFQQVASEKKYRVKEKLIYKFISDKLVFAYDDKGCLTLNSANILIPRLENYPIKAILALFNCSLYEFIYRKKFNTIKKLRGDLEQLPLPLWDKSTLDRIVELVDRILQGENQYKDLDDYIMEQFGLSKKEKGTVLLSQTQK